MSSYLTAEEIVEADSNIGSMESNVLGRQRLREGMRQARTVVDLGSGFGKLAKELMSDGKIVYGVDNDRYMIRYARRKATNGHFFAMQADVHHIPLGNNTVDGVVCLENFNEFDDPHQVMRETYRILKPGGYFAIMGMEYSQLEVFVHHQSIEMIRKKLNVQESEIEEVWQSMRPEILRCMRRATRFRGSQAVLRAMCEHQGFEIEIASFFYYDALCYVLARKP